MTKLTNQQINNLWQSNNQQDWLDILNDYYRMPTVMSILALDKELEDNLNQVKQLSDLQNLRLGQNWYEFMLNKYFKWQYGNLCSASTKPLKKHYVTKHSDLENIIKDILQYANKSDAQKMIGFKIHGLGTAGASGFLALLFPHFYGAVNKCLIKNFKVISQFQNAQHLQGIKNTDIKEIDFYHLTEIMRSKAEELNKKFSTNFWTPRKIDKVFWTIRQ